MPMSDWPIASERPQPGYSASLSEFRFMSLFLLIEQVAFDFGFDAPLPIRAACSVGENVSLFAYLLA